MTRALSVLAAAVSTAVFAVSATAEPDASAAGDIAEVRTCMERNEPETTSVQTILLTSIDNSGTKTWSEGRVYWQKQETGRSNVLLRFFDPPDMRSAGLLILEKEDRSDMWIYLPEIGRVRRVNRHMARGSLFGTDFTYEEFERLYGMVKDQHAVRLEDQAVDGRPVYVVEEHHEEGTSAYERTLMFVDKSTCVPIKSEFYEAGDRLRKVITAKPEDLKKSKNMNYAEKLYARDLRDGTESHLEVKRIQVGKSIPKRTFGVHFLETSRN